MDGPIKEANSQNQSSDLAEDPLSEFAGKNLCNSYNSQ